MAEHNDGKINEYIAVKLIENAVLVRVRDRWVSFPRWGGVGGAAEHIEGRIEALKRMRVVRGMPV